MEDIYWECFFNNAGIRGPSSKDYASLFVKNKISQTILVHINDSHLKSMGIEAIGDIIRILKYIKDFPKKETSEIFKDNSVKKLDELLPLNIPKPINKNKITLCSTYEKVPGCELPVPIRRVVTPEIEGRYKINIPTKPIPLKTTISNNNCIISEKKTDYIKPNLTPNRIVILSDTSKLEIRQNTSILKRLGESLEKYERLSNLTNDICDDKTKDLERQLSPKKQKLQPVDNKTILKRFFNATLSKDSQTQISLSQKLPLKNIVETNKGNVFVRLDSIDNEVDDTSPDNVITETASNEGLPYMGVFKLPNDIKTKPDIIKVRSGQTTEAIRKVEATSTTCNTQNKYQSIRDRLGSR